MDPPTNASSRTPVRTGLWLARRALVSPHARHTFIAALDRRVLKPVPRIRRRVHRLLAVWRAPHGPVLPVPSGSVLPAGQTKALPVAMLILLGPDSPLEEWVERVAQAQAESAGFRPLFVVDNDQFAVFRRYGYLFEYLVPEHDWAPLGDPADWSGYVHSRLQRLVELYQPSTVVVLPSDSVAAAESQQSAVLASVATLSMRR